MVHLHCLVFFGAVLFGTAVASPAKRGRCIVGDWSAWGECKPSKVCLNEDHHSYPLKAAKWDEGRLKMARMMREKEAYRARMKRQMMSSEGYFKCEGGFANNYPCRNVDQLHFLSIEDLGYVTNAPGETNKLANDLWGWKDPVTGDEYVIAGTTGGSSFVRITDPINPVVLAFMYTETVASLWRDMKVVNDHAYIVAEAPSHGMQVFDLTRLRSMTGSPIQYVNPDAHYAEFGNAHNIAANVDSQHVFAVGATGGSFPNNCRGGIHMVDVSNPKVPVFAGCADEDGYVHDTQCVNYNGPDTNYVGREVCFGYNEDSFTIFDVTDKTNPIIISKRAYVGVQYTHQGWISEDATVAFMDDELDEMYGMDEHTHTYMWDIRDLTNPILMNTHYSGEMSSDHNQYVHNGHVYQSNYMAGLRVLRHNVADFTMTEVGYYDVFPPTTEVGFSGTWSNYPYFGETPETQVVATSCMEYGLFLLRPDWALIESQMRSNENYAEQTRTRNVFGQQGKCDVAAETRACTSTYNDFC